MAVIALIIDGVAVNKFKLDKPLLRIGRAPDSDIHIDDIAVSNKHAVIEVFRNPNFNNHIEYYIKDLGSTNKTTVNGKIITRQKLCNNDQIKVGINTFKFIDNLEIDLEKTAYIIPDDVESN